MKIKLFALLIGWLFTVNLCSAQVTDVSSYIRTNAFKLYEDGTLMDWYSIKPILAGRRIIGMGEATHGTQDFQQAKFEMFKYLVTELNYRLFGIEANFTECRKINNYILYGQGDPRKAVVGLIFDAWKTTEVLKMVEWMRAFNADKEHAQKIKFYGFDMQFDKYPIELITEKLTKLDSVYFHQNFKSIKNIHIWGKGRYTDFTSGQVDSITLLLKELNAYVDSQKNNLLEIYSSDEVAYLKRDIRLLEQCLDQNLALGNNRNNYINMNKVRDKYMAENIDWILNHEEVDSKIMLCAHNNHISKSGVGYKGLGNYLKGKYGDSYYSIGFDFNKGSFQARDKKTFELKSFVVPDAKKGSSGDFFSKLGIKAFFIDIEKAVKVNSIAKDFFTTNITQRSVGGTFSMDHEEQSYLKARLYSYYDGLIFINNTTSTTPLK